MAKRIKTFPQQKQRKLKATKGLNNNTQII